jgi:periplasmic protein TonB
MFDMLLESRHSPLGLPRWGVAVAVGLHVAVVAAVLRPSPPPPEQPVWIGTELPPLVEASGPRQVELTGPVVSGPVNIDLPPVPSPQLFPGVAGVTVPQLGGAATLVEGSTGSAEVGGEGAVPESLVQDPPELLSAPVPPYPALLREAGVEGFVTVQVVVDTTGRPEPGSLRVVASTNAGFDAAAVATIRGALFRPGRVWGRAVRVLVQVPVAFRLHH